MSWRIERSRGDAAALHASAPPVEPSRVARVLEVAAPAIVLGSSQAESVVNVRRARAQGVSVVSRRSGGGAVWLAPGDQVWIDLWLPADDELWVDDVVAAAFWAGDAWACAAADLGAEAAMVHRRGLERSELADLVCFAGRGPGEVFVGDQKLVGISQRRTREWVRLQTTAYRVWEPHHLIDLLVLDDEARIEVSAALADRVLPLGDPGLVAESFLAHLP